MEQQLDDRQNREVEFCGYLALIEPPLWTEVWRRLVIAELSSNAGEKLSPITKELIVAARYYVDVLEAFGTEGHNSWVLIYKLAKQRAFV